MDRDYKFGRCGVFCEACPAGNGKVEGLAGELKRLTSDFFKDFTKGHGGFDWAEYLKGLDFFTESYGCPTCTKLEGEPWCEVLKCEKVLEKKSCLLCEEFPECPRTEYQRGRYPFVMERYERVKEIGFDGHLKEERERAEAGTLLNDIRKY
jgi:hypothetical protein